MYALYKKIPKGYAVTVKVIAVSKRKEVLMRMLPREVVKHLKEIGYSEEDIFHIYLPTRYEPREWWGSGPFDSTRFEVVPVDVAY